MNIAKPSPIQKISFRDKTFFVKRDDLLSAEFSGNKARKFAYFLQNPPQNIDKIISYGSNQSNAMYSLSVLAKMLKVEFLYVCKHLNEPLRQNPFGNYKYALQNGMKIFLSDDPEQFCQSLKDEKSLYIKEGGAMSEAEFGIKILADEINEWAKDEVYDLFLPSGTGTTALFLQKHTHLNVYTVPCVGKRAYLKEQFLALCDEKYHPTILNPPKKYHFGALKKELFDIWQELKMSTDIEFDLLYDPIGWLTLMQNSFKNPILYIHQGGVIGNESLIQRYQYKFNIK